jgi:hypothetical protein
MILYLPILANPFLKFSPHGIDRGGDSLIQRLMQPFLAIKGGVSSDKCCREAILKLYDPMDYQEVGRQHANFLLIWALNQFPSNR